VVEETGLDIGGVQLIGCEVHGYDGVPLRYSGITLAFACGLHEEACADVRVQSLEILEATWLATDEQSLKVLSSFEQRMVHAGLTALHARVP